MNELTKPGKKPYVCPVKSSCPNEYTACYDPMKFCRTLEDTPDHFSIGTKFEGYVQDEVKRRKSQ